MKKLFLMTLVLGIMLASMDGFSISKYENLDLYEATPYNEQLTLEEKNRSLGLISSYDIIDDKTFLTFAGHINADMAGLTDLMGLQISYMKRLKHFWLNGFLSTTRTTFETISHQNDFLDPADPIADDTNESIISLGAGAGYRFFWIQQLLDSIFDTRDIYEYTTASLVYHTLSEKHTGNSFTGFGLQTEFTIAKRLSPSYHLGVKTSYNISSVKRKVPEGESASANSLAISWLSLALELGFYF